MARRKRTLSQVARSSAGGSSTGEPAEPSQPLLQQAGCDSERAKNVATLVEMLREKGDILASKLREHVCRNEDLTLPNNRRLPYELALDALISRNEELIHTALAVPSVNTLGFSASASSRAAASQARSNDAGIVVELSRHVHSALSSQDPCNGLERLDKMSEDMAIAKAPTGVLSTMQETLSAKLEMAEQMQMKAEEEVGSLTSIVEGAQEQAHSAQERRRELDRQLSKTNEEIELLEAELARQKQERNTITSQLSSMKSVVSEQRRIAHDHDICRQGAVQRELAAAVAAAEARGKVTALTEVISNLDAALVASRQGAHDRWKAHVARVQWWTPKDVSHWLRYHQNGRWAQFADEFEDQGIRGELLPTLTNEDLLCCGVRQLDTRRALSLAIKELFNEAGISCVPSSGQVAKDLQHGAAPASLRGKKTGRRVRPCADVDSSLEEKDTKDGRKRVAQETPPAELVCPITCMLVKEPVAVRGDDTGHAYELAAIRRWFAEGNKTVPLTNEPVPSVHDRELLPLREHARRAAEWRSAHPEAAC